MLSAIESHECLRGRDSEVSAIIGIRAKLAPATSNDRKPFGRTVAQIGRQLEELSHSLFVLCNSDIDAGAQDATHPSIATFQLLPEVDAELFSEFLANARLSLDDFEQEIQQLRIDWDGALARVKGRIHTLKGEAGILGLADLERVLHWVESLIAESGSNPELADKLLQLHDWVAASLAAYARYELPAVRAETIEAALAIRPVTPNTGATKLGVQEQRTPAQAHAENGAAANEKLTVHHATSAQGTPSGVPLVNPSNDSSRPATFAPCPWSPDDEEFVVEFLHEVEEHLSAVDRILVDSEQAGLQPDQIHTLFRAFHTLKGVASFLRLDQFKELTHATETMLDRIRNGQLAPTRAATDLIFDATSILRELAKAVQASLESHGDLELHSGVSEFLLLLRQAIKGCLHRETSLVEPALPGEKLGEILVRQGIIDSRIIETVLQSQGQPGEKLGEQLISQSLVPPKAVAYALRAQQKAAESATLVKEVVKVDLERVDRLVETIGELVIVESMVANAPEILQLPPYLRNYLGQFAKITSELQELGMRMRMVPVRSQFQKMTRMTRDLARRSNKQARVVLRGEGTEMDRMMVEQIADPLVHLIRNAIDHGLESAEERAAAGKPPTGTINLSAVHEGGKIVIEISDDGRGIDRHKVLARAIAQGIVNERTPLTDAQVFDLIFMPGFSTAQRVTEISGRGVGLDVVKRNVEAIRGRITTTSAIGRGTTFRLVLPLTLAIIDGMVIRCGNERFILPTLSIVESLRPTTDILFSVTGSHERILVRGQTLPLVRLSQLLNVKDAEDEPTKALVIVVESLHTLVALLVDEVVMKQQVVIKTLRQDFGLKSTIFRRGHSFQRQSGPNHQRGIGGRYNLRQVDAPSRRITQPLSAECGLDQLRPHRYARSYRVRNDDRNKQRLVVH